MKKLDINKLSKFSNNKKEKIYNTILDLRASIIRAAKNGDFEVTRIFKNRELNLIKFYVNRLSEQGFKVTTKEFLEGHTTITINWED